MWGRNRGWSPNDLTGRPSQTWRDPRGGRRDGEVGTATPDGVMPWHWERLPSWARSSGWRVPVAVAVLAVALVVTAATLWRPFPTPVRPGVAPAPAGTASTPEEPRTVVSLTFNDASTTQYRLARPLLRQFGFNGTFYLPTGRLDRGEGCCMSWQQARELYRSGDELGGTGVDDRDLTVPFSADPAKDYAAKKRQVCASRERLASRGFDPRSFAYPGGAYRYDFTEPRKSLRQLVRECGYLSARIVGGLSENSDQQANAIPPAAPYVLRTPDEGTSAPITLADLQRPIVVAARSPDRQWVPVALSEVCSRGEPEYATCMSSWRPIDTTVLSGFLDWLSRAGQPGGAPAGTGVRTVRQVMGAPAQPPLRDPRAIVSLTFDDGDATQALAGEMLRARGMRGTFFVNSGLIDRSSYYLSWPQVRQLQRDGHEIGGHTLDHVKLTDSKIPLQQRRDQVCKDRTRLLEMGLNARSFAYPEGAFDRVAKTLPRLCGYQSARTAGGVSPSGPVFAEHLPPQDPFATAALDGPEGADRLAGTAAAGRPLLVEDLRRAVMAAATQAADSEQDAWVQVVLHRVCASTDPQFQQCMLGQNPIDDLSLGALLDWLKSGAPPGTEVMTVTQALAVHHQ
jgi:peptidoglycan/xylan/chitin deacetylase (PgdA/CDA1 family)